MAQPNAYELSRSWFDFCFENPDLISPTHHALYFFAIEHCNRLGWKEKYGLPTSMAMEALGIKSYNTYVKVFNDLREWGFIKLVEKSRNQYSSNIIALSKNNKANNKALDKANVKHLNKHLTGQRIGKEQSTYQSTGESIDSIDKPITNNNTLAKVFEVFRKKYPATKRGHKVELDNFIKKGGSLQIAERLLPALEQEIRHREGLVKSGKFCPEWKHLKTWINSQSWEQEFGTADSSPDQHPKYDERLEYKVRHCDNQRIPYPAEVQQYLLDTDRAK